MTCRIDSSIINEPEAQVVRHLFHRYLTVGSVSALVHELRQDGTRTKSIAVEPGGRADARLLGAISITCCIIESIVGRLCIVNTCIRASTPPLLMKRCGNTRRPCSQPIIGPGIGMRPCGHHSC